MTHIVQMLDKHNKIYTLHGTDYIQIRTAYFFHTPPHKIEQK